jgi:DNA polymerase-1
MDRYMLVDGNNLLMRAVYAADRTGMGTPEGIATGALLIFINLLSRHLREERPSHLVVCWDGGRSALRTSMYPAYKAHRGERADSPDDRGPFSQAKEFCTLAGIHHIERPGWEADDLIACAWQNIRRQESHAEVVILSGDKDLLQLLDTHTSQVRPATPPAKTDRWDMPRVTEHYGVPPEHLSKAMALIGDTSDNIPGVRGIGPVKAAKMLREAGWSLGRATAAMDEDKRAAAVLSHALVDLRTMRYANHGLHVALPPAFTPTTFGGVLAAPLLRYLDRYMLESVRTRLASQTLWTEPPIESSA